MPDDNPLDSLSTTEIFNKDPRTYTSEDRVLIVQALRRQRSRFVQEEKDAKNQGRRIKPAAINLGSIDELEIDI